MNITVFFHSKKHVKYFSLSKISIVFLLVMFVLFCFFLLRKDNYEHLHFLHSYYAKHQDEKQLKEYIHLKSATQQQLITLANKVAQMEARINQMEAIGSQIIKQTNLSEHFNFSKRPHQKLINKKIGDVEFLKLMNRIDNIILQLEKDHKSLVLLDTVTRNNYIADTRYISGRPIKKGWLSSPYGARRDPFSGRRTLHKGIDFASASGSPVISTGAGLVVWAGEMFGYGKLVEVDHGNGFRTRYGHNKKIVVRIGDVVKKGATIAKIGSTGRSTGPHVHYEVWRKGRQVNPSRYVLRQAR